MTGGGSNILGAVLPLALGAMFPGVGTAIGAGLGEMGASEGLASFLGPSLFGAGTGALSSAITGGNPLTGALLGGVSSGIGSEIGGPGGLFGGSGDAASGAGAITAAPDAGIQGAAAYGAAPLQDVGSQYMDAAKGAFGSNLGSDNIIGSAADDTLGGLSGGPAVPDLVGQFNAPSASSSFVSSGAVPQVAAQSSSSPASSIFSGIGDYIKKDPLKAAITGSLGLSALSSLLPKKKVDVAQNRANVLASDPGFNSPLPPYHMQNTATPYTGDWYKYGLSPQQPLYSSMAVPGMKHGGKVRGYAAGGSPLMPQMPMQAPQGASPAIPSPLSNIPVTPHTVKAAFDIGHMIGKKLKHSHVLSGHVKGNGGGQDDIVDAKLAPGEYVHSADIVAALGDGNTDEGAKKLKAMGESIRKHKTSKGSGFPPKARNPLSYLSKGSGRI